MKPASMEIDMYMNLSPCCTVLCYRERLAEYGWKPHRDFLAQKGLSRASTYWYAREQTEGSGFIEFETSNSTISTVCRQPLTSTFVCSGPSCSSERVCSSKQQNKHTSSNSWRAHRGSFPGWGKKLPTANTWCSMC